jgi:arylsulfatase A-like enzyme
MYQANHRVVANGAPLDDRFDQVARLARRAGYTPTLFGYTDQSLDPALAEGPDDPRLFTYEGVLDGFEVEARLFQGCPEWLDWLRSLGHDVPAFDGHRPDHDIVIDVLASEPTRPAEHSMSAYLTDRFIDWHRAGGGEPWFAHLSYLRPHPPYAAAGHFSTMYDPADIPPPHPIPERRHPYHDLVLGIPAATAPSDPDELARMRAQYLGMVSEVDHQLGRVWDHLVATGEWESTVIVLTADHGEQLGDQGLKEKLGYFPASYHIGCIVRDPRRTAGHGSVVDHFTENVDLLPTIAEAIEEPVPLQCDGSPLTEFLDGTMPERWRTAAHWEYDWRSAYLQAGVVPDWPRDRRLERSTLAALRTEQYLYVHFGDGSHWCLDLVADPGGGAVVDDPAIIAELANEMLTWRTTHLDRRLAGMLTLDGGIGRVPSS